jgi:hypothetical protein
MRMFHVAGVTSTQLGDISGYLENSNNATYSHNPFRSLARDYGSVLKAVARCGLQEE